MDPNVTCTACGAKIWRANFSSSPESPDWRAVEPAPEVSGPGNTRKRARGHVALTFPLIEGEAIRGHVVRTFTKFREHKHAAFSAASFAGKKGGAQ